MADLNLKDDPFPKEWDGEKVRDWFARRLEGRAMPEIQLLAGRAALRRLPFLGALLDIPSLGQQSSAKALLFACLRCYPISVASAFVPPTEIEGLRSAAAAANSTAFSAADSVARSAAAAAKSTAFSAADSVARSASDSALSAALSARSAADSAADSALSAALSARSAAYSASDSALSAAYSAAASIADPIAAAFEQDCRLLKIGGVEKLARHQLWPKLDADVRAAFAERFNWDAYDGGMPGWLHRILAAMNHTLNKLDDDFAVWLEWYDGILQGEKNGRYLFGLPTQRALRLNVEIALIPEEFWQDPAKANAEIRRLMEVARAEVGSEIEADGSIEDASKPSKAKSEKPKRATSKAKPEARNAAPKTNAGKALLENATVIAVQSHLLVDILDQELARLNDLRPNSEEGDKKKQAQIQTVEMLRERVLALRDDVLAFSEEKIEEKAVIKTANAFLQPFRDMWTEKGKEFAEIGARSSIFLGAVGIGSYCHMHPLAGTLVLGAITARAPLVEVLKAAKGVFKIT